MTSWLRFRVYQHKNKEFKDFTSKYNVDRLVYFEEYNQVQDAIEREKQLKAGSRQKKIDMVNSMNPEWRDLYEDLD
jgi:putative endonuclease